MAPRRIRSSIIAASLAATLALAACSSPSSTRSTPSTTTAPSSGSAAGSPESPNTVSQDASSEPSPTTAPTSSAAAGSSAASSSAGSSAAGTTASDTTAAGSALPANCTPTDMQTHTAEKLTIATDQPVYEPWFVDNKPENGQGFEGAVAYAVAAKLGFDQDHVTWVRESFDSVISPAPKDFDFDINEFSITPDRAKVVDFSSGYYDVAQAVVTTKGSKIAGAKSLADLAASHLGAQIGTTSLKAINQIIKPSVQPAVFSTNDDAVKALQNGQIDGIVTDLPTAFYMSGAQLTDGVLVGQLPSTGDTPEQFGLLLEKGSSITTCVSAAVDALRADGTLKALADKWLAQAGAPVLK